MGDLKKGDWVQIQLTAEVMYMHPVSNTVSVRLLDTPLESMQRIWVYKRDILSEGELEEVLKHD